MADERKKQVAEKIWLHYFNRELYEQGVITEPERNKMALRIENRKSPTGARSPRNSRDLSR